MSKEDDLERFDIEYSLFEVGECSTLDGSRSFIEVVLGDMDDHLKLFKDEIINIKMSDAHIHTHVDEGLIMSESLNES